MAPNSLTLVAPRSQVELERTYLHPFLKIIIWTLQCSRKAKSADELEHASLNFHFEVNCSFKLQCGYFLCLFEGSLVFWKVDVMSGDKNILGVHRRQTVCVWLQVLQLTHIFLPLCKIIHSKNTRVQCFHKRICANVIVILEALFVSIVSKEN